jgi:hypothetical protein
MGNTYVGYNDEGAQKPVINCPSSSSLISIGRSSTECYGYKRRTQRVPAEKTSKTRPSATGIQAQGGLVPDCKGVQYTTTIRFVIEKNPD